MPFLTLINRRAGSLTTSQLTDASQAIARDNANIRINTFTGRRPKYREPSDEP